MYQSFLVHWGTFLTGTSWESYSAYCQPSLGRLKKTTEEMIDEREKPWIHGCNKPPMLRGAMWWVLFNRWGKTLWLRVCNSSTLEESQVSWCIHAFSVLNAIKSLHSIAEDVGMCICSKRNQEYLLWKWELIYSWSWVYFQYMVLSSAYITHSM